MVEIEGVVSGDELRGFSASLCLPPVCYDPLSKCLFVKTDKAYALCCGTRESAM